MPSCSCLISLLTEYLEGRLPSEVRGELEKHLSGCPECTAFLSTFRSTVSLLESLQEKDLPDALRLRLRAFIDDSSKC